MALAASTSADNSTITLSSGSHTGHILVSHTGCTVEGAGIDRTTVVLDATYAEAVRPGASVAAFTLKNLTLDCNALSGVDVGLEIVTGGIAALTANNVRIKGHTKGAIAVYNRGSFTGSGLEIIGDGGAINHFTGSTSCVIRGCGIVGGQYGFQNSAAAGIDIQGLRGVFHYWAAPTYESVTPSTYAPTYVDVASHVSDDRTSGDIIRYLSPVKTFDAEGSCSASLVQLYDRIEVASGVWTQVLGFGPGNTAILDVWRKASSWAPAANPSGTATVYRVTLARLVTWTSTRLKLQTGGLSPPAPRWRTVLGDDASTPSTGGSSRLDIIRTSGANSDTDSGGIHATEHAVGAVFKDCSIIGGRSDCITLRGTGTVAERCMTDLGYDMGFTVDGTNDRVTLRNCEARRTGRSGFAVLGGPSDLYSCAAYDNGTISDGTGDYGCTVSEAAALGTFQLRGSGNRDGLINGASVTAGGFETTGGGAGARRRLKLRNVRTYSAYDDWFWRRR